MYFDYFDVKIVQFVVVKIEVEEVGIGWDLVFGIQCFKVVVMFIIVEVIDLQFVKVFFVYIQCVFGVGDFLEYVEDLFGGDV